MVFVGLAPNGFALGLHAAFGAEHGHSAVQHAQGALHFHGEVNVTGGIDQIDPIALPLTGGGGGGNGNPALLLFFHPVHGGRAFVHLTQPVGPAGIEQDSLTGGGFAGVNVRHDADVADLIKRVTSGHVLRSPLIR